MHLSLPSYCTRCAFGDFDGARLIREAGFDAVDMSYYYLPENSEALSDGYLDYSKRLKDHLDSIGLICNQAHAPFPLSYGIPFSEDDPTYRSILRSVRAAGILGAKSIVVHSVNVPYEAPESTWDYNLAFYRSLIPTAAEYGVKLAVETLFSRDKKRVRFEGRLTKPEELSAFVRELGLEYVTGCLDIGHVALCGMEPEHFIERMDPEAIGALHIQDGDYLDDRHLLPYQGCFNWDAICSALARVGYTGDFTLEPTKAFSSVPRELLADHLAFAAGIGRQVISLIEKARVCQENR